jgi:hypothetical protein
VQNFNSRLPAMSEVEKKRLILYYTTNARKQFVKLLVLLKWASNAQNIQTCQVCVYKNVISDLWVVTYTVASR